MSNRNFAQNFARRLARRALGRGRIQVAVDCALIAGDGMTRTREAAALIRGNSRCSSLPGSWPYSILAHDALSIPTNRSARAWVCGVFVALFVVGCLRPGTFEPIGPGL